MSQPNTHFNEVIAERLRDVSDCELTGLTETPDGETLFCQIQHPGELTTAANINNPLSSWPGGGTSRPRSATLAITKNGGGVIGL